jgi:hypothetical protein
LPHKWWGEYSKEKTMAIRKAKKRKKSKNGKAVRKKCTRPGCRRLQVGETGLCKACALEEQLGDPKVVKLSEQDALRFGKIDAEVRNAIQGQRLIDYEIVEFQQNAKNKLRELNVRKAQLVALSKSLEGEYKQVVMGIADKYGIGDPTQMAIDPDVGTVRDLRQH